MNISINYRYFGDDSRILPKNNGHHQSLHEIFEKNSYKKKEYEYRLFKTFSVEKDLDWSTLSGVDEDSESVDNDVGSIASYDLGSVVSDASDEESPLDQIPDFHKEWFISQAILNGYSKKFFGKRAEEQILNSFFKAASPSNEDKERGFAANPLQTKESVYYRSSRDVDLLERAQYKINQHFRLENCQLLLVDSPLVNEAFKRNIKNYLEIHSKEEWADFLRSPNDNCSYLVNISALVQVGAGSHIRDFQQSFEASRKKINILAIWNLGNYTIVIFPYMRNTHRDFFQEAKELITSSGFRPQPDILKECLLDYESIEEILPRYAPLVELDTADREIPVICKTYDQFLSLVRERIKKIFKINSLDKESVEFKQINYPGLKVSLEATEELLRGINTFNLTSIPTEMMQIFYFRVFQALGEINFRQQDVIAVNQQLEIIHQEMQNILAFCRPYGKEDLAKSVASQLYREGVVPKELGSLRVYAKPSASRTAFSILSSAETQKGSADLSILTMTHCYYETDMQIQSAKNYSVNSFDAEEFSKNGSCHLDKDKPFDIYFSEFDHNISLDLNEYVSYPLWNHVIYLIENGYAAESFTVAIDITMDDGNSDKISKFLKHPKIAHWIKEGRLNVAFYRSCQKFDMLGMDNYYGGLSYTINDAVHFEKFNSRMTHPQDQLKGLSYQGITFLQKHAYESINLSFGFLDSH
ncbi:MAG: hypothetical protein Tsb0021_02210 [Chlamydiales bacterium]